MATEQQARAAFLVGTIGLGFLIVGGLVWAVVAGPDATALRSVVATGLKFNDDNDPSQGPGESKFVVRIFSDFQCPACKLAESGLKYAEKKYGDKVRFIWNDFPLSSIHPNARPAAIAARCAEDQGKFWDYHDKLYGNQEAWSALGAPTAEFIKYAEAMGLDKDVFTSCLVNEPGMHKIKADESEGKGNNVQGTPTFFIGNRVMVGGLDEKGWDQEIAQLLKNP